MNRSSLKARSGALSLRAASLILAVAVVPLISFAAAPAWWFQRGALNPNVAPDDYAIANQGQLKNIAKAAVAEMDALLPGGAGNDLHNLVNSWATPGPATDDFAPFNLGQLKNVAKPFYDRLIAAGLAGGYPWSGSSNVADDFAIANIGQVKNLFSFDLPDTIGAPPSDLTATATSPTTVVLSWTVGSVSASTTIQASVDGGATWFTLGVTGRGVSRATITGLTPGTDVMFAVSYGGTADSGSGNSFAGPDPNATGGGPIASGAAPPAEATPLRQPVIEGEESSYHLGAWGFAGFMMSYMRYLTETILITNRTTDHLTGHVDEGTWTQVHRIDPFTAGQSVDPPVITGSGAVGFSLGEPNTGQHAISDTLLYAESLPGDVDSRGNAVYKSVSFILSDLNDEATLRGHAEGQIPAFEDRFTEGFEFADIYVDNGGYEITRLQYRWRVNSDPNLIVTWDVQFTSYEDNHIEHEIHRWPTNGATLSPTYVIDPRYQHGGANGYYDVILLAAEPMVDGNRDGSMGFNDPDVHGPDATTTDRPYRFWLNDDDDTERGPAEAGGDPIEAETVPAARPDYSQHAIVSKRNLEDFARLWIDMSGAWDALSWGMQIGLKWKSTNGTTPAINIYPSADGEGSDSYLKDDTAAQNQISDVFGSAVTDTNNKNTVDTNGTFIFKSDYWNGLSDDNPKKCFLFEGKTEGKGELEIVFLDLDGNEIAEIGSVWLDLKNIKKMYERASATPDPLTPLPYNSEVSDFDEGSISYTPDVSPRFEQPIEEDAQCLIFVHGWRMSYEDSVSFSETMFKRLWWQGYKGRFAAFRWATQTSFDSYNTSEWLAWKYGKSLHDYVENYVKNQLSTYSISVAAHSMGNIVTGSALRRGMAIDTYMLMEAAIPSGCYNDSVNNYSEFYVAEQDVHATPDVASDNGYRLFLSSVASNVGKFVSFYNSNDFALQTGTTSLPFSGLGWPFQTNWVQNEIDYKPNALLNLTLDYYDYFPTAPAGSRSVFFFNVTNVRTVVDPHETMAFVARPRSRAAGAEQSSAAVFSDSINMEIEYGFTREFDDHGGQFMRSVQRLDSFYKRMFDELR
jgi:hypothetical protein